MTWGEKCMSDHAGRGRSPRGQGVQARPDQKEWGWRSRPPGSAPAGVCNTPACVHPACPPHSKRVELVRAARVQLGSWPLTGAVLGWAGAFCPNSSLSTPSAAWTGPLLSLHAPCPHGAPPAAPLPLQGTPGLEPSPQAPPGHQVLPRTDELCEDTAPSVWLGCLPMPPPFKAPALMPGHPTNTSGPGGYSSQLQRDRELRDPQGEQQSSGLTPAALAVWHGTSKPGRQGPRGQGAPSGAQASPSPLQPEGWG